MSGERWKIALLGVLVLAAVLAAVRGWRSFEHYRLADRVCQAVARGDLDSALALSRIDFTADLHSLQVAECRATALLESGRKEEMVELLDGLLEDPRTAHWLPGPIPTAMVVEARQSQGRLPEAADLAHRGALRYPDDLVLLYLEMQLRTRLEPEDLVLDEILRRLPPGGAATPVMRLRIAERWLDREDWGRGLELVGDEPPTDPLLGDLWYQLRLKALGGLGREAELRAAYESWLHTGGDPKPKAAFYALTLSYFNITDKAHDPLRLLRQAAEDPDFPDPELQKSVRLRYLATLIVRGFHDQALEFYDRMEEELGEVPGLSREEILRSRTQRLLLEQGLPSFAAAGRLVFHLADPAAGDRLLVSPPPEAPVDADYESLPFDAGRAEVEQGAGTFPVRWVLRDDAGRARASGTVWPTPGDTVEVAIQRREAAPPFSAFDPAPAPPDGRRRVFVVVLDCADWRLVQYGRARGEHPVFDYLIDTGWRAVLHSEPAFTAVAIHSLVFPSQRGSTSFLGLLHQMGTEIEALNAVGRNPVAALRWLLPGQEDLFSRIGSSDLSTVNMLRAFGPLPGGRNAEIVGPHGRTRLLTGLAGSRPPTEEERRRFPRLFEDAEAGGTGQMEEMAADFDTLVSLARAGEIDLVMFRVASLDLMTHRHFYRISSSGQDDGEPTLYQVYRYMDQRLGELFEALDGDDVLVVMSDHGIRTALEHDPRALFVAAGGEVPHGRTEGQPALRGIGRMLADLFGLPSDWPATGIEAWVARMPAAGR